MATSTSSTPLSSISSGHIDLIAAQEPSWLASIRKQAFSQYQSLPAEVSPLYSKYSDVNRIKPESIHFTAQTTATTTTTTTTATRPAALSKDLNDRLKELEQETGILQVGQEIHKIFI
nr:hypothetical protein [Thermoproteota archaeon]